ncbi:cytochrome c3 family protein [Desulfatibacillum aliphaticivorans]|uniref:cytochrome c3 family protein n=1 Tax=Desulfatibacillum aliphaticivorans TaxID=218208 RepID=UPI0004193E5E|nr:cytochrome c3 family protein [Desulfatibacillum aliphaticivorans]
MKVRTFALGALCTILAAAGLMITAGSAVSQNAGAAQMTLNGGKTGDVPFPHGQHQTTLGKCDACHGMFPQEKGVIDKNKADGSLKSKAVMNQCTGCHKEMKKAGEKTGPTSCRGCHQKN